MNCRNCKILEEEIALSRDEFREYRCDLISKFKPKSKGKRDNNQRI